MNRTIAAFAGAVALTGVAWTSTLDDAEEIAFGDPIEGQALFAQKGCVRCHAVRGAGGRIGPDLGRKEVRSSYFGIAAVMWNHSRGMEGKMREYRISRPLFEDDELSNLISFLYFLHYFDEPGDPRAGKLLFSEKHCSRCHRVGDEGGETGPPLDRIPRGISPLRIAQSLWNHGPQMVSAISDSGLEVPTFAGDEIIDLFSFVRSHGQRTSARRFESPGDPVRGQVVFQEKGCALCHEIFGEEPSVGPDLGTAELRGTVTQIAGRMWNHWPTMSRMMQEAGMSVPQFGEDELLDLFAYVYIARFRGTPGSEQRGGSVFEDKGCAVCHGSDGQGGIGPNLRAAVGGRPAQEVMQRMWNHAPRMASQLDGKSLSWARFSADELADLLAFLSSDWSSAADH